MKEGSERSDIVILYSDPLDDNCPTVDACTELKSLKDYLREQMQKLGK